MMLKQLNIDDSRNTPLSQATVSPLRLMRLLVLSLIVASPFLLFSTTTVQAGPAIQTTPLPTSLTITNVVEPPSDTGLFVLLVNGQSVATDVGSNDSSGAILLPFASTYTVSVEAGANTDLASYSTTISCKDNNDVVLVNQPATSVEVNIADGTQVTCEVRHIRRPVFIATLNDAPWMDLDGVTEAGDVIQLTAQVTKSLGVTATDVIFNLPIDPNTRIISGTASTSMGAILLGNNEGDTALQVNLGAVTDTTPISITVNIMVDTPLPADVDIVSFQGTVSADNSSVYATDDPSVPALNDPTQVSVTAKPLLNVTHANRLLIDSDANGEFSSGDRIYYEVTVINIGNGAAQNMEIIGNLDPNTTLIPNTILQSAGNVTTSTNVLGVTELMLSVDVLEGGGARMTMQYQVVVNQDISVTSISSQFEVTADEPGDPNLRIRILSDDPSTLVSGDPTVAPIVVVEANSIYLPVVNGPTSVR